MTTTKLVTAQGVAMSDPAIEAAQRAWDTTAELTTDLQYTVNPYAVAKAAAREALRPIRELYEEQSGDSDESAELWVFLNKLAPLIFTTEELER